jgi:5-(carboxyamino)imidazole ribonucleotide mutase
MAIPRKKEKNDDARELPSKGRRGALVSIIMGSESDYAVMQAAEEVLKQFGVAFETRVVSAHRTPLVMAQYAREASTRGLKVIIAGAGGAAHLPGMVAAHTELPVIGVPVAIGTLQGIDALHSIVQMPKGVPVATVAIGNAWNAGILAVQILAAGGKEPNRELAVELKNYKRKLEADVERMNRRIAKKGR